MTSLQHVVKAHHRDVSVGALYLDRAPQNTHTFQIILCSEVREARLQWFGRRRRRMFRLEFSEHLLHSLKNSVYNEKPNCVVS